LLDVFLTQNSRKDKAHWMYKYTFWINPKIIHLSFEILWINSNSVHTHTYICIIGFYLELIGRLYVYKSLKLKITLGMIVSHLKKCLLTLSIGWCIAHIHLILPSCKKVPLKSFWGTPQHWCAPWSWRPASSRWSPCQSPPWTGWWSPPACACTSALCARW